MIVTTPCVAAGSCETKATSGRPLVVNGEAMRAEGPVGVLSSMRDAKVPCPWAR